jgi:hypothetical protein
MTQKMTLVFALALAAALPISAEAQGHGKSHGKRAPGQSCRAEGGTSNSRACRDRYGDQNHKRNGDWDDRDSDSDRRYDRNGRVITSGRTGSSSVCVDRNRDGYCDNGATTNSGICVDRNRDGRCDYSTTTGSTNCTDRDRDGICDSRDRCVDRNNDGRCETTSTSNGGWDLGDVIRARRYPSSLPLMQYAPRYANGERLSVVRQWLGSDDVRVRYSDRNRDGRIETATWLNPAGGVLQVWQDLNRDGRADRVQLYDRGRVVRTIQ